jgi:hypothetical protein
MIPAFVIHDSQCHERDEIVQDIVNKTGAIVVEAILCKHGAEGCTKSHLKAAELAKELFPHESYLVFEDDCCLIDGWDDIVKKNRGADLIFVGYTDMCEHTVFGTHSLYVSPKTRDCFLLQAEEIGRSLPMPHTMATDWIYSRLVGRNNLRCVLPMPNEKNIYCFQKKGLRSTITGKIRQ